tara:strand:- start:848 stop:1576 length:729 start_codon:yes stop_codon:yes gene_type:complete
MINASKIDSNQLFNFIKDNCSNKLNSFWLGKVEYQFSWDLQKEIHELVSGYKMNGIILYLEHDAVYTFGKNADKNHLLPSYPRDANIVQIDRGGDITYHGPGQLVGYPIINLNYFKKSISWYMRSLENIIIKFLIKNDIISKRMEGLTGVWVNDEKICAMGVRLAKWTTMHGFALNIKPEMKYFDGMIPCGIFEYGVTSLTNLLIKDFKIEQIAKHVDDILQSVFLKEFKYEITRVYKKTTA